MNREKIIYLSGPETASWHYGRDLFEKAEALFVSQGWEVINRYKAVDICFGGDTTLPKEVYLRKDIELLVSAHAIAMLPWWGFDTKSELERAIAEELGLECIFLTSAELDG